MTEGGRQRRNAEINNDWDFEDPDMGGRSLRAASVPPLPATVMQ
jgi:hypothetical protein